MWTAGTVYSCTGQKQEDLEPWRRHLGSLGHWMAGTFPFFRHCENTLNSVWLQCASGRWWQVLGKLRNEEPCLLGQSFGEKHTAGGHPGMVSRSWFPSFEGEWPGIGVPKSQPPAQVQLGLNYKRRPFRKMIFCCPPENCHNNYTIYSDYFIRPHPSSCAKHNLQNHNKAALIKIIVVTEGWHFKISVVLVHPQLSRESSFFLEPSQLTDLAERVEPEKASFLQLPFK